MQVPDVEDTIKRVSQEKGVKGVIVATRDGVPIKTTMDNTSTVLYLDGIRALEERCNSIVRDIDPTNELRFLRVRSERLEIMLSTEKEYMVVAIQDPNNEAEAK